MSNLNNLPLLIAENENQANQIIKTLQSALPQLALISDKFSELDAGSLDNEMLSDILLNDGKETATKCLEVLSGQLAGQSKVQIASMLRVAEETIQGTLDEIRDVARGKDFVSNTVGSYQGDMYQHPFSGQILKYISFESGKPVITNESIKQVREDMRLYIKTKAGKHLHETHLKAISALNELSGIMNATSSAFSAQRMINIFFPSSGTEKNWSAPVIDYDHMAK